MVNYNNNIEKSIVLFDGECNFCNSTVLYIIKHDKKDKIGLASQQSEIGIKLMKEAGFQNNQLNTIVLIKNKTAFIKTDALIEICKLLVGFPKMFVLMKILPSKIRDYFYDIFSKHRYNLFGKKKECMMPTKEIGMKFLKK
jgi:predicted DCC family thiol-disulfide oxidoreductase YuxK